MKRVLLFLGCLLMISGCSASSTVQLEDWPEKVEGEYWTITKVEEEPKPAGRLISYLDYTVGDLVRDSALIVTVTIPEPVYYAADDGLTVTSLFGYEVTAEKVHYSDSGIKAGDTVRFIRSNDRTDRWVTLAPGSRYILMLNRYSDSSDLAKVAEYYCGYPNETILSVNNTTDEDIRDLIKKYK